MTQKSTTQTKDYTYRVEKVRRKVCRFQCCPYYSVAFIGVAIIIVLTLLALPLLCCCLFWCWPYHIAFILVALMACFRSAYMYSKRVISGISSTERDGISPVFDQYWTKLYNNIDSEYNNFQVRVEKGGLFYLYTFKLKKVRSVF